MFTLIFKIKKLHTMKTRFFKPAVFAVIAAGILSSCVQDDDYGVPSVDCVETSLVKTIEVSEVPASAQVSQFTADEVIALLRRFEERTGITLEQRSVAA